MAWIRILYSLPRWTFHLQLQCCISRNVVHSPVCKATCLCMTLWQNCSFQLPTRFKLCFSLQLPVYQCWYVYMMPSVCWVIELSGSFDSCFVMFCNNIHCAVQSVSLHNYMYVMLCATEHCIQWRFSCCFQNHMQMLVFPAFAITHNCSIFVYNLEYVVAHKIFFWHSMLCITDDDLTALPDFIFI